MKEKGKALLALEDGRYYRGCSFGASGEHWGEVVFNTSMTGYQEIQPQPGPWVARPQRI
jgi:carbamoyl-phosphate synthase small subunit